MGVVVRIGACKALLREGEWRCANPRLEQRLKMAPQIIQSIEILELPLMALQERIEQEQLENPVLKLDFQSGA